MAEVVMEQVQKSFGKTAVIKGVDIHIKDGDFCVFVGPSGCGKSTLLRLLAGLEDITSGTLKIDGKIVNDVPPKQRGLGMVFQSYALYPHMTVRQNMAFGLKLAGKSKAEMDAAVEKTAEILQLTPLLERKPKEMSGGQRQRVAIGRAIVRQPKVYLFDEPLSNLDAALRVEMRIQLAKLHSELKATMVYVTHDQVEAMTLATKIIVLQAGVVEQAGTPLELYHHPANAFVAGFIGSPKMNMIDATVEAASPTNVTVSAMDVSVDIPAEGSRLKVGDTISLGLRPEHLTPANHQAPAFKGKVEFSEHLGESTYLYLRAPSVPQLIVVKAVGDSATPQGAEVSVHIPSESCYLFTPDGKAVQRLAVHSETLEKQRARA